MRSTTWYHSAKNGFDKSGKSIPMEKERLVRIPLANMFGPEAQFFHHTFNFLAGFGPNVPVVTYDSRYG